MQSINLKMQNYDRIISALFGGSLTGFISSQAPEKVFQAIIAGFFGAIFSLFAKDVYAWAKKKILKQTKS